MRIESHMMRIRCAVCDKPVERILTREDIARCRHEITVVCHGDNDTMMLDHLALIETGAEQFFQTEGVAFQTNRISK